MLWDVVTKENGIRSVGGGLCDVTEEAELWAVAEEDGILALVEEYALLALLWRKGTGLGR